MAYAISQPDAYLAVAAINALVGMSNYIVYFNQQWVGDHSEEWFEARGPLSREVVEEMKEAGVLVFAGGVRGRGKEMGSQDRCSLWLAPGNSQIQGQLILL